MTTENIKVDIEAVVKGVQAVKALNDQLKTVQNNVKQKVSVDASAAGKGASTLTNILRLLSPEADNALSKIERLGTAGGVSLGSLAGPAGAAVAAVTAIVGAAGAAGAAVFAVAKSFSDFGSEIFDTAQKTSFSTESLSALKLAAEQSGASLQDVGSGLIKFEKAIVEAASGNQELSKTFKALGIDAKAAVKDPEEAFNQFIRQFATIEDGALKTELALRLFGKSGANLIPTFETLEGDFQKFKLRAAELGLTLDKDAAKAADDFGDTLDVLSLQAKGAANTIGREVAPTISQALKDLSKYVSDNREAFRQWGQDVAAIMRGLRAVASSEVGEIITLIARVSLEFSGVPQLIREIKRLGGEAQAALPGPTVPPGFRLGPGGRLIPLQPGEAPTDYLRNKQQGDRDKLLAGLLGAKDSRGGKNKQEKDPLEPFNRQLEQLDANLRAAGRTSETFAAKQQFLASVLGLLSGQSRTLVSVIRDVDVAVFQALRTLEKTNPTLAENVRNIYEKIKAQAAEAEKQKAILEGGKAVQAYLDKQIEQLRELRGEEDAVSRTMRELDEIADKHSITIRELTKFWARFYAVTIQAAKAVKEAAVDLIPLDIKLQDITGSASDSASEMKKLKEVMDEFERMEGPPPVDRRLEQIEKIKRVREALEDLAFHITNIFDRALDSLFEKGFKGFFKEIVRGFADMLKQMLLMLLQSELLKLLAKIFNVQLPGQQQQGGGLGGVLGGILGKIFKSIFGGGSNQSGTLDTTGVPLGNDKGIGSEDSGKAIEATGTYLAGHIDTGASKTVGGIFDGANRTVAGLDRVVEGTNNIVSAIFSTAPEQTSLIGKLLLAGISIAGKVASAKAAKRAGGGLVDGPGTETSDSIPAWLSKREFVVKASSVRSVGTRALAYINRFGRLPSAAVRLAAGGLASGASFETSPMAQALQGGGDFKVYQQFHIHAKDANSFRQSQAAIERDMSRAARRGVSRFAPQPG